MRRPRIVFVTRRFWPLVGSEESLLADLACEFQRQGAMVRIVTAQWQAEWPTDCVFREVPVTRIRKPVQLGWGTLRYMMGLARWFRTHAHETDLVYVSHMQQDAHAVIGAIGRSRIPVVLRAIGTGADGDCQWQQRVRFGSRIRRRCQQADAVIAASDETLAELLAAGYAAPRTFQIANGVPELTPRCTELRADIREALWDANLDLITDIATPVVAFVGKLTRAKGVFDLVRAWKLVDQEWPDAKLWLIGDGPDRDELYDFIGDQDLRYCVFMPGTIDWARELLPAVDLCVVPTRDESGSLVILESLAAETPLVASDTPSHRALVQNGEQAALFPPGNSERLAAAICAALNDPALAATRAASALRHVRARFDLTQIAATHLELFERLMAAKRNVS